MKVGHKAKRGFQYSGSKYLTVVSIGRLTAFFVILVPVELIPSKPPHTHYVIVVFSTLQKGSTYSHLNGRQIRRASGWSVPTIT